MTMYVSAMFQDWENLSSEIRQRKCQEGFEIGNSSER